MPVENIELLDLIGRVKFSDFIGSLSKIDIKCHGRINRRWFTSSNFDVLVSVIKAV